jgi:6,7-dimethyl-8-ribityllumazine synthase
MIAPDFGYRMRLVIIASRFNSEIVDGLLEGANRALVDSGVDPDGVPVFRVPGAFEIPLAAKRAAISRKYDAVIAIGCLIRGETPHFEYISNQTSLGIGLVALETGVPVAFGVITVNNDEQAVARAGSNNDNKGYEAAMSAIEMVRLLREI